MQVIAARNNEDYFPSSEEEEKMGVIVDSGSSAPDKVFFTNKFQKLLN